MTLIPLLIVLFGLGFAVNVVGILVNFKSVRAGRGASPTGIAITVSGIVLALLALSIAFLMAVAATGVWPLAVLIIPILAFAIFLLVGAVQGLRGQHRS